MTPRPTGTVTFLFTDIEGSTTRWEHQRQAMQQALARHDAIMRDAIEAHGGHVFKTVGDTFYAVFTTAPDAVDAALHAQTLLQREAWDEVIGALRVRMALHTGTGEARDGDYFGQPLNRVARLLSAGHGAQILLSTVTQELVRDQLPAGTGLRDLGEHRLKDLIRPERVFQLVAPDLPRDFPPLKTLDTLPNNLPLQRAPLVGREREITAVRDLLLRQDVGLVTLTGTGGTGKTRLGLQVAADALDEFQDGVFFVNLAPVSDPDLVLSTVAQTLGVVEAGGQPLLDSVKSYLQGKHLLLLLDNFEQVLAAAPLVAEVLATSRSLKLLVTSRVALRLSTEYEYAVPPLSLPDPRRLPSIARLSQYEAVAFFIQRAQAVRHDFAVTSANAPAVAEICVRLDGLPLAIELAAARVKLLSPQALLQRLSSRLTLLTGGARDLPARQQTLRATIDWSYSVLDPAEQILFARLAVFVGGRTLEAVAAVCNADGDLVIDPFDGVASLLDKSLLRQEDGPDGEPRFIMLETIHEYAHERLAASGEGSLLQGRHAEYFLTLAEQAEAELDGPRQVAWLNLLEAEHDNVRAALRHMLDHGNAEVAGRLCTALHRFWAIHGHVTEARQWLAAVLAHTAMLSGRTQARVLFVAGKLASLQSDFGQAQALLELSLALCREQDDPHGIARALHDLGGLAMEQGDVPGANTLYEEGLALWRQLEDKRSIAATINNLGCLARDQGDYGRALLLLQESLELARELGHTMLVAVILINVGSVMEQEGDSTRAQVAYAASLALARELGNKECFAYGLEGLGGVAAARGQAHCAARLFGAAEAVREVIDTPLSPVDHRHHERRIAVARAHLNEAAWTAAWAEGREMPLEQAVTYALDDETTPGGGK
jgi:predicted ATPase/class 3 adenylate cyclase